MPYAKELLDRAVHVAGSQYKLALITGLQESHISEAMRGKTRVPASWVRRLAIVAGEDAARALERVEKERGLP